MIGSATWSEARQDRLEAALGQTPRPVLVGNPDIVAPRATGFSVEPGYYAHRLADLRPEVCGDHTLLRTAGVDQPTLHGTMARLADLGLEITSVERIDDSE